MGKYMRKCRGAAGDDKAPAVVEPRAQVMIGVRTRSRSAAVAAPGATKRRKQATTARVAEELGRDGGAAGCYLQLRSRRLFMAAAAAAVVAPRSPRAEEASPEALADSRASGEVVMAGISCCYSTAPSVDRVDVAARERSGGEAEACEGRDVESSVSDSEWCQERRETTPSSRPPIDKSDLESTEAADEQKHQHRRSLATRTTAATFHIEARAWMPPAAEIEEFFAAAEKAEAERFTAKYNFDVVRGVPLNAGRFEWTPVASG